MGEILHHTVFCALIFKPCQIDVFFNILLMFYTCYLFLFVCVHVYVSVYECVGTHSCHNTHVEVRGQLLGAGPLLLPCDF